MKNRQCLCRFLVVVFASFLWIGCSGDGSSPIGTAQGVDPPGDSSDDSPGDSSDDSPGDSSDDSPGDSSDDSPGDSSDDSSGDSSLGFSVSYFDVNARFFTDNSDDTVTDDGTKLLWQKADDGVTRNWEVAGTYCADLDLAGESDWRLPSIGELQTVNDYSKSNPAVPPELVARSSYYWSSTPYADATSRTWRSGSEYGDEHYFVRSLAFHVRCVARGPLPPPNFEDLTLDGQKVIRDRSNGLWWQGTDAGTERNWQDAINHCQNLTYGGKTDWRLPSVAELSALVDYGKSRPASDAIHGMRSSNYWSSTDDHASSGTEAWRYSFIEGKKGKSAKNQSHWVRCVYRFDVNARFFTDNSDDTVTDNRTGLLWQKADDGVTRNWETARTYCTDLDLAGESGWRLPSIGELETINDYSKYERAVPSELTARNAGYWSSTPFAGQPSRTWRVWSETGVDAYFTRSGAFYVRCVAGDALPSPNFEDLTFDGQKVIYDRSNGLLWQGTDSATQRNWQDAANYCQNLTYGGKTDWRLPNVSELHALVDYGKHEPASDAVHGMRSSYYWSTNAASEFAAGATSWSVYFGTGRKFIFGNSNVYYVRCVSQ